MGFLVVITGPILKCASLYSLIINKKSPNTEYSVQHDDQLKSGLPWMEVHLSHWLPTKGRVPNACVGGFGDLAMSLKVRGFGS